MKVAVYGAGGAGGYFGGRLALAGGTDVHLIARGAHLKALRKGGLRVKSVHGDFEVQLPATDDPAEIGPCDYVLFTVKAYDTGAAAERLEPLVGPGTAIVSLQNGIENEEKIAARVGWEHVLGGAAYIFTTIAKPGLITHSGGPSNIVFGEMHGSVSDRARRLLDHCERAGIDAAVSDAIREVLWTKFIFICAQAGTTAATQLPIGEIRAVHESRELFRRLIEEVRELAAAEGVHTPHDLADRQLTFADQLEPDGTSSLYYDLSHGNPMELEALHGAAVRRGAALGLEMCTARTVHAVLRPWAVRNQRTP